MARNLGRRAVASYGIVSAVTVERAAEIVRSTTYPTNYSTNPVNFHRRYIDDINRDDAAAEDRS